MSTLFAAVEVTKRTDPKPSALVDAPGVISDGSTEPFPTFASLPKDKLESQSLLSSQDDLDSFVQQERKKRMEGLWILDGVAYDFTDFVAKHPGGSAAIGLGRGLDCSELFKTYHLIKSPSESILKKYRCSNPDGFDYGTSRYSFEPDGFIMTIRQRARDYFKNNNLSSKGSPAWQALALISLIIIPALMYPAFVMGLWYVALALGFLKGFTAVTAGHTMSHFSLFSKPWLNSFVFRVGSPLVLSTHQIWSTSHVVSHHIDTLTPNDLQDNYPVKRVQPALPFKWFHRFQHIYIWVIYLFGVPLWTMSDLVESIPVLFHGRHAMRQFTLTQRLENTIVLALNIFLTIAFPFIFQPFWNALLVCLLANVPASLMLVIQIAVNHEVPETMSKTDPSKHKIDWGSHQVLTSHNFGVNSAFALHFSGGLNYQIEHHLFPSVHYTHYPALSTIVQDACKEFNLPYNTSKHLLEATAKHYTLLKMNSKE